MCNEIIVQHCLEQRLSPEASAYADGRVHVLPHNVPDREQGNLRHIRRANFHAGLVTLDPTIQSWPEYPTLINEMLENESRNPLRTQVRHFLRRSCYGFFGTTYSDWFFQELKQLEIEHLPKPRRGIKGWRHFAREYNTAARRHPSLAALLERCVRPAHVYVRTVQTNAAHPSVTLPLAA